MEHFLNKNDLFYMCFGGILNVILWFKEWLNVNFVILYFILSLFLAE